MTWEGVKILHRHLTFTEVEENQLIFISHTACWNAKQTQSQTWFKKDNALLFHHNTYETDFKSTTSFPQIVDHLFLCFLRYRENSLKLGFLFPIGKIQIKKVSSNSIIFIFSINLHILQPIWMLNLYFYFEKILKNLQEFVFVLLIIVYYNTVFNRKCRHFWSRNMVRWTSFSMSSSDSCSSFKYN